MTPFENFDRFRQDNRFQMFYEILVNAADNKQRDPKMDTIKIDIKPEENIFLKFIYYDF